MAYTTVKSGISDWMDSSGHRANILGEDYTSIGIGCIKYDGSYYWVQCFGLEGEKAAASTSYKNKTVTTKIKVYVKGYPEKTKTFTVKVK